MRRPSQLRWGAGPLVVVAAMGLSAVATAGALKKGLPRDIAPCRGSDKQLNDCITQTANQLFPRLAKGDFPELGLGSLDPILVPRMAAEADNTVIPGFRFDLRDTRHRGWGAARMLGCRAQPEEYRFDMEIFLPVYRLEVGHYDMDGRILLMDVRGEGTAVYSFFNNTYQVKVKGQPFERKGKRYMKVTEFHHDSDVEDMHLDMTGLFGNAVLNNATLQLMNWNSKALVRVGMPLATPLYSPIYEAIITRLFDSVPYNEMFPDVTAT